MASNLFGIPQGCKSINKCGEFGFPDRCQTCGHESYQPTPAPAPLDPNNMLGDYKQRMDALFDRINIVISTLPKDK